MTYEAPAIEARFEVHAALSEIISPINPGPILQPAWRSEQSSEHGPREREQRTD